MTGDLAIAFVDEAAWRSALSYWLATVSCSTVASALGSIPRSTRRRGSPVDTELDLPHKSRVITTCGFAQPQPCPRHDQLRRTV
jgi:hypothetical protein